MDPQEIAALREQFTKLNDELKSLGGTAFKEMPKDVADVQKAVRLLNDEINDIKNAFGSISQTLKNTITDFNSAGKVINSINSSYSKLSSLTFKVQQHTEGTNRLSVSQLKNIQSIAKAEVENLRNQRNAIANKLAETTEGSRQYNTLLAQAVELNDAFADQNGYLKSINTKLEEEIKNEIKINKNLGISGQLFKGISKTLQGLGVDSEIIEEMGTKLKKAADDGQVGFKQLFPIIKEGLEKALQDPLVKFSLGLKAFKSGLNDIKKAFDIFLEFNTIFTETGRNVGMSADQVTKIVENVQFAEKAITGFNGKTLENVYSAKQIAQAFGEINNQLGLSVDLGAETTAEFVAMTNQMGLSGKEAANIYKLGKLNNLSLVDTNKAIAAQIVAVQKSTGVQLNAKQIFQEIGKLSAGITAKFQQNPELIAKAVAQAKALGTTLEQIDKVGESLLNFEQSIEAELKAELLTGKQLNLERARAAALVGDQAALMEEVASQVGDLEDFNKLNVIAQKSLAEAFGLSRDELADMLQQQEVFNKLGDVSGKSAAEQLEIARQRGLSESDSLVMNLKQQAASEKLAATFDSLKVILADLLEGPFGGLVDAMSSLAKNATLVKTIIGILATVSLAKTIGGLAVMAVQLGIMSATAAATASALTLGIGAVAIIAALSAISSATDEAAEKQKINAQQVQDGIASSSRGPFTVTDAYGATAITAKGDSLAVSPNIKTGGMNDSGLVSVINDLRNAINVLANKPTPEIALNVNGQKLGEVVGRQSETGTNQYQNAYRLA